MNAWLVAMSIEVIGQGLFYSVDGDDEVVGIRAVLNRYDVVFSDGRVVSVPANSAIVVYKEVSKEEYLANMNTLRQPIMDMTF